MIAWIYKNKMATQIKNIDVKIPPRTIKQLKGGNGNE
jgi:hypothetical protein